MRRGKTRTLGAMKHYVDAPAGSEDFRKQFTAIRDAFLLIFKRHIAERRIRRFNVVGLAMGTVDWVKTSDDAERFMASMIDEGFCVAFRGTKGLFGLNLHVCYWEDPQQGPEWPRGTPVFEVIHEGVIRGKAHEHGA
jgi:hypothetical protein